MADALVPGRADRRSGALRCFASLAFIFLLTGAFWSGALWLARVMVQVAGRG